MGEEERVLRSGIHESFLSTDILGSFAFCELRTCPEESTIDALLVYNLVVRPYMSSMSLLNDVDASPAANQCYAFCTFSSPVLSFTLDFLL